MSHDLDQARILIIEDEPSLLEVLRYNLEKEGFEVYVAPDGQSGLTKAREVHPDLVILDLMLPVMEGYEVCRQLRRDPDLYQIRILMLTARSEEADEIVGFNLGADDYVTKPFKMKPLMHRIKALLRRGAGEESLRESIQLAGLTIDRLHHRVLLDGEELKLTPTEFRMLWTLATHPGRPFNRNELLDRCRGEDANALERTIDVHVRSLRQKLGRYADWIETVRGIGYRFRDTAALDA
ncbi:MAG: DNA-binding response regulator [Planctomycetaceae bacterium]|nr:MAG: DNA-binding response regulator [Planctomycetaceae bacterium]